MTHEDRALERDPAQDELSPPDAMAGERTPSGPRTGGEPGGGTGSVSGPAAPRVPIVIALLLLGAFVLLLAAWVLSAAR